MLWGAFWILAIDSIYRDLRYRRISNLLLLFNFLILNAFWNRYLFLLILAPLLTSWIGAGDLKLITVLYLYSRALQMELNLWLIFAAFYGLLTALILRSKSIPFAPALIFALLTSDYLAREWWQI